MVTPVRMENFCAGRERTNPTVGTPAVVLGKMPAKTSLEAQRPERERADSGAFVQGRSGNLRQRFFCIFEKTYSALKKLPGDRTWRRSFQVAERLFRSGPSFHEFPVPSGVKGILRPCGAFIYGFLDGTEESYIKAPRVIDRGSRAVTKNSP